MTEFIRGVDVSHWQNPNDVDYAALRSEGFEWCIARANYGTTLDRTFDEHIAKAWSAGLTVGGYMFYRQEQNAQAQLDAFRSQLDSVAIVDGDILPVVDLEWDHVPEGEEFVLNRPKFVADAQHIIDSLSSDYGGCMVYLAPGFFQQLGSPAWLKEYPWWVAHYKKAGEPWCPWVDWVIHQHTGKGRSMAYANGKRDLDMNAARSVPLIQDGHFDG